MTGRILVLPLLLFSVLLTAQDFYTSFARGKWDRTEWLTVKGPRFPYVYEMVQNDDHITNPVVAKYAKSYGGAVYSAQVLKYHFEGDLTVSAKMSFDQRMAPLLVIAPELGRSADGKYPEFREHYEIVLFDQGINIWHHLWRDGKPYWYKAAYMKAAFKPKTVYELQVQLLYTPKGCQLIARCGGHELGYTELSMRHSLMYVGLIACEGNNRFYDFKVTVPAKKAPKRK